MTSQSFIRFISHFGRQSPTSSEMNLQSNTPISHLLQCPLGEGILGDEEVIYGALRVMTLPASRRHTAECSEMTPLTDRDLSSFIRFMKGVQSSFFN